jgi:hypothetical protein
MKELWPEQEWESPAADRVQEEAPVRRRRTAPGYDGRSERRTLRRAAQRRRRRTRLGLVTAPVLIIIAVVVALLVLFGGPDGDETAGPATTVTTVHPTVHPTGQGGVLVIGEDDRAEAVILFAVREATGVMLVVPGSTLLLDGERFSTVADIYRAGGGKELGAVLQSEFGVGVMSVAAASWSRLQTALAAAGVENLPTSVDSVAEAAQLAGALSTVVSGGEAAGLAGVWRDLELRGDDSGFRAGVAGVEAVWRAAAVTGKMAQGEGFEYLEPDVSIARALLTGSVNDSAIAVELENGSGVVGAVEGAAAQLEPLGYRLSPSGNAEDFPNAPQTRIIFSTGADQAAARIRALLGVGVAYEDPSLLLDNVVVVLGKDYAPPTPVAGN